MDFKMVNWRKGLFRFWVVISAFWIIGIVVFTIGEYNKAAQKEYRLKHIVSEIKNPEKALSKIKEEFPEYKRQYDFIDMGPVHKSKESTGLFDEFLSKPKPIPQEELKKLSDKDLIELVKEVDKLQQSTLQKICETAENDSRNKLYNIFIFSFIPPCLLVIIGSAIYWVLRGFRA
jgi:hypothetical protein